jgi:ABC-type nitrate/sulfonate/bicarbonate transport system permease component
MFTATEQTRAETVHGRINHARRTLTPTQIGLGFALVAALLFALLFVQEPMVHDSLHNARHAAGITCH